MGKEEFEEYINAIKQFLDENEKANEAVAVICEDSYAICSLGYKLLDSYIKLLQKAMGDEETEMISWFIFENKFGNGGLEAYINGKEYQIKNPSHLYEFIKLCK